MTTKTTYPGWYIYGSELWYYVGTVETDKGSEMLMWKEQKYFAISKDESGNMHYCTPQPNNPFGFTVSMPVIDSTKWKITY